MFNVSLTLISWITIRKFKNYTLMATPECHVWVPCLHVIPECLNIQTKAFKRRCMGLYHTGNHSDVVTFWELTKSAKNHQFSWVVSKPPHIVEYTGIRRHQHIHKVINVNLSTENETGSWPSHSTDPNCPRGRLTGLLSNHVTLYSGVNQISQGSMLVNQISLINFQNADQILIHFRARFVKSHSQFKIISMEFSLDGTWIHWIQGIW